MRKALLAVLVLGVAWGFGPTAAHALSVWDEGVDGDLSGDRFDPTPIALALGSNELTATSVSGDREYVVFTLPAGAEIDSIPLVSWTGVEDLAFIAVQAGTTLTEDPLAPDVGNLLGWTHFAAAQVGDDLLDDIAAGAGAIGFTPPLDAPPYTFWIQETGPVAVTYTLNVHVTPEPASGLLGAGGLGLVLLLRRWFPASRKNWT